MFSLIYKNHPFPWKAFLEYKATEPSAKKATKQHVTPIPAWLNRAPVAFGVKIKNFY